METDEFLDAGVTSRLAGTDILWNQCLRERIVGDKEGIRGGDDVAEGEWLIAGGDESPAFFALGFDDPGFPRMPRKGFPRGDRW